MKIENFILNIVIKIVRYFYRRNEESRVQIKKELNPKYKWLVEILETDYKLFKKGKPIDWKIELGE